MAVQGVTVMERTERHEPSKFLRNCSYAWAVLSVLAGGGTFILGIIAIVALPNDITAWAKNSAIGIWAGAIITFTGIVGVLSTWKWHNRVLKGCYIFLGVITTLLSLGAITIIIIATVWYAVTLDCRSRVSESCDKKDLAVVLHLIMMVFCIGEFIIAIVGASIACSCCCQGRETRTRTVVVAQSQPMLQNEKC